MKKTIIMAAILGLSASVSAHGHSHQSNPQSLPNYDFVELGGYKVEGTNREDLYLGFSKSILDNYFVRAEWQDTPSADLYNLGLGYRHQLSHGFDVYGGVSYLYADLSSGYEDGYDLFVGTRYMFNPQLELNAEIKHVDLVDDYQQYQVGARWYFHKQLSVGASYAFGEFEEARLGVSWHF